MKKTIILLLFLSMTSPTLGLVSTRVCEADGITPFDGRDIMVGTWLTIIVSSDTNGEWPCDLALSGDYRNYGLLLGRDFNEISGNYDGSIFENAIGQNGYVYFWHDEFFEIDGLSYTGDPCAVAGDWFIVDYKATSIGDCNVGVYEWWGIDPIYGIPFFHVRTRDFNKDSIVDFADLYVLTSYWLVADCNEPDWCEGTDLDTNHNVDFRDFALFCNYWLETTGYNSRPRDFNKDTKVNFVDFAMLASHWQVTNCGYPGWCQGTDIDADGNVDFDDLGLFVDHWLEGTE